MAKNALAKRVFVSRRSIIRFSKLSKLCLIYFISFLALCSPACSGTTDTCDAGTCKCGTEADADACASSDTLSNRCVSGVCLCGVSTLCTIGTTTPVCLDQRGKTPGTSNTVATCKVRCDTNLIHILTKQIF